MDLVGPFIQGNAKHDSVICANSFKKSRELGLWSQETWVQVSHCQLVVV